MRRLLLLAAGALVACAQGPEPIRWGTDTCDQCRMVLDDRRFGVEWVDRTVTRFDGLEEYALYRADHPGAGALYVSDAETGALIAAEAAVFLASPDLHGPMGGQVVAFATRAGAERYAAREGLHAVRWLDARAALAPEGGPDARD